MSKKKQKLGKKKVQTTAPKERINSKTKEIKWPLLETYKLSGKWMLIVAFVSFGLAFLQYGQTLPYEYVLDDVIVVKENNFVKKGFSGIYDLMTTESFVGYFGEQKDLIPGARYRPLSLISFAIEYGIFGGLNSWASHLINVLLYGLCGWLLFLGLSKVFPITKKPWLSIPFLALVLWMSHPVHSEAVANIKGRDEVMTLIFALITLIFAFKFFEKKELKPIKNFAYLATIFISFFLGLLSKENTITFLAIIPASLFFFRKPNRKKMWMIFGTLLASFFVYLAIRISAVGYLLTGAEVTDIMNNPFYGMSLMERMATVFYVLLKYIGLSFIPYPLTHDYYPFQIPKVDWSNIFVLVSLVFHVGLAVFAAINFKKRKVVAYLVFFYIAALSISSNILINVGTTMNERFLFAPTIATSILTVIGVFWLTQKVAKNNHIMKLGIIGLISFVYLFISFNRTQVWKSALSLNEAAVKVSTNSARANSFMATALFNKAKDMNRGPEKIQLLEEASVYADKAVALLPDYNNGNLMKAGIAGELHKMDRDLPKLLKSFETVAINRPSVNFLHEYLEYISDRHGDEKAMMDFYYRVGYEGLINTKKRYDWGLKFLNYAHEMDPNQARINFAISKGYQYLGNQKQSNLFLSKTLEIDPSYQNK